MQCPVCKKEMTLYKDEPSYDKIRRIIYKRTRYVCYEDDVWARLEVPEGKMDGSVEEAPACST